jgi:hypothetical protein
MIVAGRKLSDLNMWNIARHSWIPWLDHGIQEISYLGIANPAPKVLVCNDTLLRR